MQGRVLLKSECTEKSKNRHKRRVTMRHFERLFWLVSCLLVIVFMDHLEFEIAREDCNLSLGLFGAC